MLQLVPPYRKNRTVLAGFILLLLMTAFGCTTGVKKDPGLTDFEAPGIPQNVVGIGKERAVLLTWSANTEADLVGYRVYRSTNSGGPFTLITTVSKMAAPQYLDDDGQNGLVNDQYYYYKVAGFDTQGKESDLSRTNAIQARAGLPVEERPPRVVNIKARASQESVYVSWDKVTGMKIKGYNIYRGLSTSAGGVQWITAVPQDTPGYIDTSVSRTSAEQYVYVIRSYNDMYTESENSDPIQVTLKSGDDTYPQPPYDLAISNDTDPILSWKKPLKNEDGSSIFDGVNPTLDLDSYLIFRSNPNDRLFSLIGIVEDNGTANLNQTFKDVNGTAYNLYAVRAIDRNGNVSRMSSIVTQSADTDIPAIPTGLKAFSSKTTEGGIKLSWEPARNAVSYNIYFSTFADSGFTKAWTANTAWTETSNYVIDRYPSNFQQNPDKRGLKLEYGVSYFFKVSAVSASNKESDLSSYVKAMPGGDWVGVLEGEDWGWGIIETGDAGAQRYLIMNTSDYPFIDYYSGSGIALFAPNTVGTSGDAYGYGNSQGDSTARFFNLPTPSSGQVFRFNVIAYIHPNRLGGNYTIRISDNNNFNFTSTLMEKSLSFYNSIDKGRTAVNLGQILLESSMDGVIIRLTANNSGAGNYPYAFLDSLVFVRIP
jgi:fibronectin type 3 domain-containing protein